MQFVYKLTVFLLLSAMLHVAFAGPVLPQASQPSPPAGCHHHGDETPAPQPANYTCCQAGHNSAILQSAPGDPIVLLGTVQPIIPTPNIVTFSGVARPEGPNLTYQPPGGLPLLI